MLSITARLWLVACLLAGLFVVFPAQPAHAAGIVVTSSADEEVSDGNCTLREAILAANLDAAYLGCAAGSGADSITFAGDYTITLTDQLPAITSQISINGNGQANTVIRANASAGVATDRLLYISGALNSLTLSSLSLLNGRCAGACASSQTGGAIYASGASLTLTDVLVSGNQSSHYAGAVYSNDGSLVISGSTFSDNTAVNTGGAIYVSLSTLDISNSTFSHNISQSAIERGGAIYVSTAGTTTVSGSTFSTNQAAYGGAIYNATGLLVISSSTFTSNTATQSGGALHNINGGTMQISGSTFSTNDATSVNNNTGGGAIFNASTGGLVSATDSTFTGNGGHDGGAIYNLSPQMTLEKSTFSANIGDSTGGALYNTGLLDVTNSTLDGNQSGLGGAIFSSGTLYLSSSTLTENQTIYTSGGLENRGTAYITNTILANGVGAPDCYNLGTIAANVASLIETNSADPNACGTFAIQGDPLLGKLGPNGGPTDTAGLSPTSPAIDTGSLAECQATDQRGVSRVQGPACDIGAYEFEQSFIMFTSQSSRDGWVLESTESSGAGGTRNYGSPLFYLGDSASDQQYRAILSFNTNTLPAGAVITGMQLQIRREGLVGTSPFNTHGNLKLDMKSTYFASTSELQLADFKAAATLPNVGIFTKPPTDSWYSAMLPASAGTQVNRTGLTQFRLRFATDDNDDLSPDYMRFYSGNSPIYKPVLIIYYYVVA